MQKIVPYIRGYDIIPPLYSKPQKASSIGQPDAWIGINICVIVKGHLQSRISLVTTWFLIPRCPRGGMFGNLVIMVDLCDNFHKLPITISSYHA